MSVMNVIVGGKNGKVFGNLSTASNLAPALKIGVVHSENMRSTSSATYYGVFGGPSITTRHR